MILYTDLENDVTGGFVVPNKNDNDRRMKDMWNERGL